MLETSAARATVAKARGLADPRERVRLAYEAHGLVEGINSGAADAIRSHAGGLIGAVLAALPDDPAMREWVTLAARVEAAGNAARLRRWIDARRAARPRPSPVAMIRLAAWRIIRHAEG